MEIFLNFDKALRLLEQEKSTKNRPKQKGRPQPPFPCHLSSAYISGTTSSATMLMILISGFTAGPAVSL